MSGKTDNDGKTTKSSKGAAAKQVLEVIGPRGGFRRCGIEFGPEPTRLDPAEIGKATVEAILAEPKLQAGFVDAHTE